MERLRPDVLSRALKHVKMLRLHPGNAQNIFAVAIQRAKAGEPAKQPRTYDKEEPGTGRARWRCRGCNVYHDVHLADALARFDRVEDYRCTNCLAVPA